MVAACPAPRRPVVGGEAWAWRTLDSLEVEHRDVLQGTWLRLWHKDKFTPESSHRRDYGPLHRFDHHERDSSGAPQVSPTGRTVIYLARELGTALAEVFGDLPAAQICPRYRVSAFVPVTDNVAQDLTGDGCMKIGALPSLCSADLPREQSQAWGQAIYEDRPAAHAVAGALYLGAHNYGDCQVLFDGSSPLGVISGSVIPGDGLPLITIRRRVNRQLRALGRRADWVRVGDCKLCQRP